MKYQRLRRSIIFTVEKIRNKCWLEQLHYDAKHYLDIEQTEQNETGPENERGPEWFANDGIDYKSLWA